VFQNESVQGRKKGRWEVDGMKESVAIAKEADAKKGVSPTKSDKNIPRVRDEPERQLGSLRDVIGNITRNGCTPSVESIAAELSGMSTGGRAPTLLALQKTHGNRYVQRVVSGIQAKLVVGQPDDKYEQEADRVAEQVMRMPEPQVQRQPEKEDLIQTKPLVDQITPLIQKQVEEKKEEEEELQAKELPGQTSEVTPNLEDQINAIKGSGQPLSKSSRAFFEPRFGQDFSNVRIHNDSKASEIAKTLNAKAFTTGKKIVFGAGQFAPETNAGRWLLAHELAHTIQQRHDLVPSRVHNLTPSRLSVQRVCGSRAIGRPSGCTPVGGVSVFDISSSSDELYLFDRDCDDLKPRYESRLELLATRFGPNDVIEIHGFASEEGSAEFNEHLSCARALKAESVLTGEGILLASISVFMHGATPGPSREHRSVVIPLPTQASPPIPTSCTPNPSGTHLPPVGHAHPHVAPPIMLPCLSTEAYVRTSPNWCLDPWPHTNETCYRQIPTPYRTSSNQYCYTTSGCCHSSPDRVSPVDPSSPGAGSTCSSSWWRIPLHGLLDYL
jgi:outer membrane protein OmpA-like peptidoglycan-associated protein